MVKNANVERKSGPKLPVADRLAGDAHRALVSVVLEGGGLPELAQDVAALLGGALLVTSPDGRVLAQAGELAALQGALESSCFEATGRFRTESERWGLHDHDGMEGSHAVVPILAGGTDLGRIVAFSPEATLSEVHLPSLEQAATVAALVITKQHAVHAVESKYQADFLRDLLYGRVTADEAIRHAETLGWNVDRSMVVVVAEFDPIDPSVSPALPPRPALERFTRAWQSVVGPRDERAPVVGFNQEVVVLLGAAGSRPLQELVGELVRLVSGDGGGGRRSFSTGVSRPVEGPAALASAYDQARKAVRAGRRLSGPRSITHFDSLGVFRLLTLIEEQSELEDFARDILGGLTDTASPDMSDLRRTLEVLLEFNLNVAEAARALHFHYNTLRYRISKLERILGPFTTDAQLRVNITLALQVLQLIEDD